MTENQTDRVLTSGIFVGGRIKGASRILDVDYSLLPSFVQKDIYLYANEDLLISFEEFKKLDSDNLNEYKETYEDTWDFICVSPNPLKPYSLDIPKPVELSRVKKKLAFYTEEVTAMESYVYDFENDNLTPFIPDVHSSRHHIYLRLIQDYNSKIRILQELSDEEDQYKIPNSTTLAAMEETESLEGLAWLDSNTKDWLNKLK